MSAVFSFPIAIWLAQMWRNVDIDLSCRDLPIVNQVTSRMHVRERTRMTHSAHLALPFLLLWASCMTKQKCAAHTLTHTAFHSLPHSHPQTSPKLLQRGVEKKSHPMSHYRAGPDLCHSSPATCLSHVVTVGHQLELFYSSIGRGKQQHQRQPHSHEEEGRMQANTLSASSSSSSSSLQSLASSHFFSGAGGGGCGWFCRNRSQSDAAVQFVRHCKLATITTVQSIPFKTTSYIWPLSSLASIFPLSSLVLFVSLCFLPCSVRYSACYFLTGCTISLLLRHRWTN